MKIHQLPHGARFEYEGEEYEKTGPMFATNAAGQQRMIPKYAVLKPLDSAAAPKAARSETLPRPDVLAAFAAYHARCAVLVPVQDQPALDAARLDFLKALGE
ncbi:MAG TPA: hypothetical protein VF816_07175 [Rhodocyclaceae bacterium]